MTDPLIHDILTITDIEIKKIAYVSVLKGKLSDLLIVYLCETATENVTVSFEHQAYVWADEAKCRELLPKAIIIDFEKNQEFDIFTEDIMQALGNALQTFLRAFPFQWISFSAPQVQTALRGIFVRHRTKQKSRSFVES